MFDFLKSFESVNGSCISGILLDGNLCFVALEIEDILGFDNLEFSIDQHLAFMREGKEYNILVGGKLTQLKAWLESQHYSLTDLYQGVKDRTKIIVLTKVGLQSLLFRWDFPQPLQSNKDWLAFEVLPAIEKIIGARSLKKKEKTEVVSLTMAQGNRDLRSIAGSMLKNELEIAKLLNIPDLQAKIEAVEVVDTLCGVDFCPVQDNGASKKDKVETGRLAKSSSASRLRVAKLLGVPEHYVHVVSPAQDIPDEMLSPKEIGCLWGGISKSEVNKNLQTLNLQVFLDGHWVPTSEGARMSEIAITENRKGHFYRWNYLALEEKYREKLQNLR